MIPVGLHASSEYIIRKAVGWKLILIRSAAGSVVPVQRTGNQNTHPDGEMVVPGSRFRISVVVLQFRSWRVIIKKLQQQFAGFGRRWR